MVRIFSGQDEIGVQTQDSRCPGGVLARERDMDRSRNVSDSELHGRTRIDHNGALRLKSQNLGSSKRLQRRQLIQTRRALPVQFHITREILGPGRKGVGQQVNEFIASPGLQCIVGASLFGDGGGAFRTHLAPAKRTGSVRGKDLGGLWKRKQFFVKALEQEGCQLLRRVICREVGPAHIADEKSVARKDGAGLFGPLNIGHQDADAFHGVAGSLKKLEAAAAELNGVAVFDSGVGEGRASPVSKIDAGAGALSQLAMAGDKVRMQMCFDDVLDGDTDAGCRLDVYIDVALGIDDRGHAPGTDQVGRVSKATEVETLHLWIKLDRIHAINSNTVYSMLACLCRPHRCKRWSWHKAGNRRVNRSGAKPNSRNASHEPRIGSRRQLHEAPGSGRCNCLASAGLGKSRPKTV